MRCAEPMSRVVVAGIFIGLGAMAGMAGTSSDDPPVPLQRPGVFRPGRAFTRAQRAACAGFRRLQDRSPCRRTACRTAPSGICCRPGAVAAPPSLSPPSRRRKAVRFPISGCTRSASFATCLGPSLPFRHCYPSRRRKRPRKRTRYPCSRTHRYGRWSMRSSRVRQTGPSAALLWGTRRTSASQSAGDLETAGHEADVGRAGRILWLGWTSTDDT